LVLEQILFKLIKRQQMAVLLLLVYLLLQMAEVVEDKMDMYPVQVLQVAEAERVRQQYKLEVLEIHQQPLQFKGTQVEAATVHPLFHLEAEAVLALPVQTEQGRNQEMEELGLPLRSLEPQRIMGVAVVGEETQLEHFMALEGKEAGGMDFLLLRNPLSMEHVIQAVVVAGTTVLLHIMGQMVVLE
jgi:hypothetical protein